MNSIRVKYKICTLLVIALAGSWRTGLELIRLTHTTDNAQGNAVIAADANDTITLIGVTTTMLQQHLNDFHIV
jgi:hypothetical protein